MGHFKTLRHISYVMAALCLVWSQNIFAQATYESNVSGGNGDWDETASWTLAAGSPTDGDGDGIPDGNDDVIILAGDRIDVDPAGTVNINDVTVFGQLNFPGNGRTLEVAGNFVMSGTSSVTGNNAGRVLNVTGTFTVSSGASASISGQTINVTGATTIDGSLSFINSTSGTKTFGDITVSGTGTWNVTVAESFTVNGNLVNNGSWTGCSNNNCVYDFTSTTGTISGSSTITVADILIDSPADITNTGTLVLTDDFTGTGSYSHGNGGSLEFTGGSSFTVSTIDLSAATNTLIISSTSNLTLPNGTYYDLVVNHPGSNRTQIGGNVTINNDVTINGGEFRLNAGTSSIAGDVLVQGGEFSPNNAAVNLTISGGVNVTSGNFDFNNGTVEVTGALSIQGGTLNDANGGSLTVGSLTIDSGETLELGGVTFSTAGASSINGTITIDGNGGTKTFADLTVSGTGNWNVTAGESFTVNGSITSNGSWTGCSNANACTYTLTENGGSISGSTQVTFADLTIDSPAAYTNNGSVLITDDFTGTGSFTNGNGSSLELSGAGPFSISTFDASTVTNTVTYSGGGAAGFIAGDYYDLTIAKTGTNAATVSGNTNVANELVISSGGMIVGAATLDVTGNITVSGGELSPNNIASIVNVGGVIMMSSGLYDHNDGDVNVTGDFSVTGGTFTMNETTVTATLDVDDFSISNGTVTLSEGQMNVTGPSGLTVNSGSLTVAGNTLTITNDYDVNGGTNDFNSGTFSAATLDIASSQAVTIGNLTFTIAGDSNINGSITFDNNNGSKSFEDVFVNSGGSWNNTTNADFSISGNIVSNGASWTGCGSLDGCDYTLTSISGTISGSTAITLSDLIIDAPASYTNQTTLTVTDRFTGSGAFVNSANQSLTLGGGTNNISNFTTSATGTTVTYNRSGGDQGLNPTTDGQYYNLVINTGAAGDDVTMSSSETVTNQLTMTLGDLLLAGNTITIEDGITISGGSADSYIGLTGSGVLRQNYSSSGATLSFPIGDGDDYSPISSFTITSGTFAVGAYLDITLNDGNLGARNTGNMGLGGDDDGTNAVDYITRYWTLSGSGISNEVYNATYQYTDLDVVGTESNLVGAVYRIPPGFGFQDWRVFGAVNPTTNTVSITRVDRFGILFAMDNTSNRLPIVLISFDAKVSGNEVILSWSTATEINNDFFTIQRSKDGFDWDDILTIKGAGNSSQVINYTTRDPFPLEGRSFYRLKQTDFDGSFSFSEVSSVFIETLSSEFAEQRIYPSPISQGALLNVSYKFKSQKNAQLKIYDMEGNEVYLQKINPNSESVRIRLPNHIEPGLYILKTQGAGFSYTSKFLVL